MMSVVNSIAICHSVILIFASQRANESAQKYQTHFKKSILIGRLEETTANYIARFKNA